MLDTILALSLHKLAPWVFLFLFKHPFVKSAKGVSILRDLINEAMDVKLKRQEAQQREVDQDDEENSVSGRHCCGPHASLLVSLCLSSISKTVDGVGSDWSWRLFL